MVGFRQAWREDDAALKAYGGYIAIEDRIDVAMGLEEDRT